MEGSSLFNPGFLGAAIFFGGLARLLTILTWRDNISAGKYEE